MPHIYDPIGSERSFGNLVTGTSLQCLHRSGYRSVGSSSGYAFESNSTIEAYLTRIQETQEFSMEAWLSLGEQYNILCPYLSFSIVDKERFVNNASFSIEHFENLLLVLSTDVDNKQISFRINKEPISFIHYIITFQLTENATIYRSYINGTQVQHIVTTRIHLDGWQKEARLVGSFPRSYLGSLPRWEGEVYYLGFYDHVLSEDQVRHNFNCSFPPSLPSLQHQIVHGNMNTLFPILLDVYDHNLHTQTNLIEGYTLTIRLTSLPIRGTLYNPSTMQPILQVPLPGLVINTTLYFQPLQGEYSNQVYSSFNITLENPYGISTPQNVLIFVDWVNSPPVVRPREFLLPTHQPMDVAIEVIDIDNDKNETLILSISPACSAQLQNFTFTIQFEGGDETCFVEFVVGDSHGLVSNKTRYTFHVTNQVSPHTSSIDLDQAIDTVLVPVTPLPNMTLVLLNTTCHGEIHIQNGTSFLYVADPFFFSIPSTSIDGQSLHNPHPIVVYAILHKGLLSPPFSLALRIHHVNTPPLLDLPTFISFPIYTPVPVEGVHIQDQDQDTQLCELRITTITGFFTLNTTNLVWKEGNYGEGMDDNLVVVQGSLSKMNDALSSLQYRAVYRLNDTMQITLIDGNYNVTGRIQLRYLAEETNGLSIRFWIIVFLITGFFILLLLSFIWNCFTKCYKTSRRIIPITKRSEGKVNNSQFAKKSIEPNPLPPFHLDSPQKSKTTKPSSLPKNPTCLEMKQDHSPPLKLTQVPLRPPQKPKKVPPPPPTSLPPVILHKASPEQVEPLSKAPPKHIEPVSKASTKPPSVI